MPTLYGPNDTHRFSGAASAHPQRDAGRSPYRKDYARLLHAPSFRRLQGKTQLFPGHESDFFRNRLTHSLEVSQIAAGIAERINNAQEDNLRIDVDLVAFAGLAHDLGHPPFGHNGEKALDQLMLRYGGFEGNAQTLHILASVERRGVVLESSKDLHTDYGLDLCYRTLAAVLKYDRCIPVRRKPRAKLVKGYYVAEQRLVREIKRSLAPGYREKFKTLECQIMDLADDIAYSTYDLEDSFHAGFLTPISMMDALVNKEDVRASILDKTNDSLSDAGYKKVSERELLEHAMSIFGEAAFNTPELPKQGISEKFRNMLAGVMYFSQNRDLSLDSVERTRFTAQRIGRLIGSVQFNPNPRRPIFSSVSLTPKALMDVEILKHLNFELNIRSPRLAVVEHRGKALIKEIFTALRSSKGALLPPDWQELYKRRAAGIARERLLCDFIAGMTDKYAIAYHDAIAGEGMSIFDPL